MLEGPIFPSWAHTIDYEYEVDGAYIHYVQIT